MQAITYTRERLTRDKGGCDIKGGGVVPSVLLPSMTMDNCDDKNDGNSGDIYDKDDVPDHNYCFKDGSLSGTGTGEILSCALDEGSGRLIYDGKFSIHNGGDDENNIDKSNGFLSGRPHRTTIGTIIGQLVAN